MATKPAKKTKSSSKSPSTKRSTAPVVSNQQTQQGLPVNKKIVAGVLILAVVLGLLYYFRGLFVVAMVNGQPITRYEIVHSLEQQYGNTELQADIVKYLILQEAQKEQVSVSDEDINNQVKQYEASAKQQGLTLDAALAQQGMTMDVLKDRIKIQLLAEKMLKSKTTVTDKEAQDYFNANKSSYPEGTTFDKVKQDIKSQLGQQKLMSVSQSWIQGLKQKANIVIINNY